MSYRFTPRPAREASLLQEEDAASGMLAITAFIAFVANIIYHCVVYFLAGARWRDAFLVIAGSITAQLAIAGSTLVLMTLYRWGHPRYSLWLCGAFTVALAAASVALPHWLVGWGWMGTLFGALFSGGAVLYFMLAICVGGLHTPGWWMGWHARPIDEDGQIIVDGDDSA